MKNCSKIKTRHKSWKYTKYTAKKFESVLLLQHIYYNNFTITTHLLLQHIYFYNTFTNITPLLLQHIH